MQKQGYKQCSSKNDNLLSHNKRKQVTTNQEVRSKLKQYYYKVWTEKVIPKIITAKTNCLLLQLLYYEVYSSNNDIFIIQSLQS